jgi:hypothetical protein
MDRQHVLCNVRTEYLYLDYMNISLFIVIISADKHINPQEMSYLQIFLIKISVVIIKNYFPARQLTDLCNGNAESFHEGRNQTSNYYFNNFPSQWLKLPFIS